MINRIYYNLKFLIPRRLQIIIRRIIIRKKRKRFWNVWPIAYKNGESPSDWTGWQEGKKFAIVLTHDVETQQGHDKCEDLSQLEYLLGFRSSFNFVPERYSVSPQLRGHLTSFGFEVGVHGLLHDGKLFKSKKIFIERSRKINNYLKSWEAAGFRSPAMHHNLDWLHYLNIQYDASTFDTDPFEPQSDNVNTIFPFCVNSGAEHHNFVELPYTLPQDFTLFVLMKERNIDIWKRKLDWIAKKGGMVLLITHPDYMSFNGRPNTQQYPAEFYTDFLRYVKNQYQGEYWHGLPGELAAFIKMRYQKMENTTVNLHTNTG